MTAGSKDQHWSTARSNWAATVGPPASCVAKALLLCQALQSPVTRRSPLIPSRQDRRPMSMPHRSRQETDFVCATDLPVIVTVYWTCPGRSGPVAQDVRVSQVRRLEHRAVVARVRTARAVGEARQPSRPVLSPLPAGDAGHRRRRRSQRCDSWLYAVSARTGQAVGTTSGRPLQRTSLRRRTRG